jgi:hypothetical protein
VVERGPEKAGVGGSIPSLATTLTSEQFRERPIELVIIGVIAVSYPEQCYGVH